MTTDPPPVSSTNITCIHCGYDLTGTSIGSACPECGEPVLDSIRRRGAAVEGGQSSGNAVASLVFGLLGIFVCAPLCIFAIIYSHLAKREMELGNYSQGSHTMATIGGILGWLVVIFWGIMIIMIAFA